MKIFIYPDSKGEIRTRIQSGNGEIVAQSSEGYETLQGCLNGLRSSIENIVNPSMIKRKKDKNGSPFFTIDSPNGRILLKGQSYSSNQAMENGISALIDLLTGDLNIIDETDQPIDIEILLKAGLPIPTGKKYKIIIDGKKVIINEFGPTGKEILASVGKKTSQFELIQKFSLGRTESVEPDERVDLRTCGVEKFVTIPLDQTNGKGNENPAEFQRDFSLLQSDQLYLDQVGYKYDLIRQGNQSWIVIQNFPVPKGYQTEEVNLALLIPANYPDVQIDMAYFSPVLKLETNRIIPQTQTFVSISNKSYQRWSRHRTSQNSWRPGVDDISTHIFCVNNWLKKEVR